MTSLVRGMGVACGLMLAGCVSMVKIEPVPGEQQSLRYYSGAGLMTSTGANCTVVFGPLSEVYNESEPFTFFIGIHNRTTEPVLVDPAGVSARFEQPVFLSTRWREMRVIDKSERITRLERDKAAAQFSAVMLAATAAVQASQPSTVNGSATGPSGTYSYSGTVTNPAASATATQLGASNALSIAASAQGAYAAGVMEAGDYLAKNTVMPGEHYNAITGFKKKGRQSIAVEEIFFNVNVCDEAHDFLVAISTP